ncbi:MAG: cytochrome c oxidase assembly protein [Miltoncostaeaceae bacterium]
MIRRGLPITFALAGTIALALALTAVAGVGGVFPTGHSGWTGAPTTDLMALWSVPPVEVSAFLMLGAVYLAWARAPETGVTARHRAFFLAGIVTLIAAVVTPIGGMSQQGVLAAHMIQHTVIGGFAPLMLLLGIPPATAQRLLPARAIARIQRIQHPFMAFGLWTLSTVVWLIPAVHHEVLVTPALWVVQQFTFLALGTLMWMPVVERVPAPDWFGTGWKGSYMTGVWTVGLVIANVYWFSGTAFYGSHAAAAQAWGISALQDQANAGTVMMLSHCLLAFGAITLLFFRQAQEGELRQKLVEAGIARDTVEQAIRRGGARELASAHGVAWKTRAGID